MSSLSKINPNCAGIDIGNESIFIGIEEQEVASFGTFTDDYLVAIAYLKEHKITAVAMEATGVYYEHLAHFLFQHKYQVAVILPNKIRNYAKSLESKSKTDPLDAAVITRFGLERLLTLWTPPSETIKALRDLCREYHCLKANCTQIKNQLHALKSSFKPHRESFKRKLYSSNSSNGR